MTHNRQACAKQEILLPMSVGCAPYLFIGTTELEGSLLTLSAVWWLQVCCINFYVRMKLLRTLDETADVSFSGRIKPMFPLPLSGQIARLVRHLLKLYNVWVSLTMWTLANCVCVVNLMEPKLP